MSNSTNLSDVFISYSRKDGEFVRRLDQGLKTHKQEVWVDWEDIPLSADWWEEIKAGIEAANTFLFVVTPASINSEVCYKEIDYAVHTNKRFIPLIHEAIENPELQAKLHPAITSHNWIFFRNEDDFEKSLSQLLSVLDTDLDHVRTHTRLLLRAREWNERKRDSSFLMSGTEVREAEQWLAQSGSKHPKPTELHTQYILESRNAQTRKQRFYTSTLSAGLIGALALTFLSLFLFQKSQTNLTLAENNALTSDANAIIAFNNAATATSALGRAQFEADNAQTQAALAQINANEAATQAAIATREQGRAEIEAGNAQTQQAIAYTQAAIAANAQAQAQIQAENAQTQQAIAVTQAAIATQAQGQAQIAADKAQTQQAIAVTQAAIATRAQGRAQLEAENAETQQAIAYEQAAIATRAQGAAEGQSTQIALQVTQVAVALQTSEASEQTARAQALAVSAEEALDTGDTDLALPLALASLELNPDLTQAQSILTRAVTVSPVVIVPRTEMALITLDSQYLLTLDDTQQIITLQTIADRAVVYQITSDTPINDMQLTLDGSQFITAGEDGSVSIRVLESGQELHHLAAHEGRALAIGISPDKETFISSGINPILRMWNIETGEEVRRFIQANNDPIDHMAFSADGSILFTFTADENPIMGLWNLARGQIISRFEDEYRGFSRDNRYAWTGGSPTAGNLTLWTAASVTSIRALNRGFNWETDEVLFVDFSPDNKIMLVGIRRGDQERVMVVNIASSVIIREYDNAALGITSALISPLGEHAQPGQIEFPPGSSEFFTFGSDLVLSTTRGNKLLLWSLSSGRVVREIGVEDRVMTLLGFSADGEFALTLSADDSARVWNAAQETTEIGTYSLARAVSPDGSIIVTTDALFGQFVSTSAGERISNLGGHQDQISAAAFSLDGSVYLSGDESGTLIQWSTETWREMFRGNLGSLILDIQISADRRFAIIRTERETILWDVSGGTIRQRVSAIGMFSQGASHFSYFDDDALITIDTASNEEINRFAMPYDANSIYAISEDGTRLTRLALVNKVVTEASSVWGQYDIAIEIYNAQTGTPIRSFEVTNMIGRAERSPLYGDSHYPFAFNPDRTLLLLGSPDSSIVVFDLISAEQTRRFVGHTAPITNLAFNPDGLSMISLAMDGTFFLWDVVAAQPLRRFVSDSYDPTANNALIEELFFTQTGNIVIADLGWGYTLWRIDTLNDVAAWTRNNRAVPDLSCSQRSQYNVLPLCDENGVVPGS